MSKNGTVITVVFDGHVLRPESPLDLEPNMRYVVTIEPDSAQTGAKDAWDVLEHFAGTVDAPTDWSTEHDHYLYGTSKRRSSNPKNQA